MTAKRKVASVLNVVKTYDGLNVVDDVSFDLFAGQTTVLVGPNGSGKTTTLEMLVGLRSMSKGSATIAGIPVVPGGEHRFYTGVQLQAYLHGSKQKKLSALLNAFTPTPQTGKLWQPPLVSTLILTRWLITCLVVSDAA